MHKFQDYENISNFLNEQNWNINLNEEKKKKKEGEMEIIFRNTIVLKKEFSFNLLNILSSYATNIYFNYSSSGILLSKQFTSNYVFIFSHKLNVSSSLHSNIEGIMNSVLLMTYRYGFSNRLKKESLFNSTCSDDSGWGCMIRSCQMILSKVLIEIKKAEYLKQNPHCDKIPFQYLQKIREEVLLMFYDNYIPIEKILDNSDFAMYIKKFQELKLNKQYDAILGVFSPYSIQVLCQVSQNTGNYTSDMAIINSILKINNYFFTEEDRPVYIYLKSGIIKKELLFTSFCQPYVEKRIPIFPNDINHLDNFSKTKNQDDIITYEKKKYFFSKKGALFISMRLGLYEIEESYISSVKNVFKYIRNNIGFVGGKKNYGYYFIGISGEEVLYLDPHYCQKAVEPGKDNGVSYLVKNIYKVNISEISSQMTFGFSFTKGQDILDFIKDIQNFPEKTIPFIQIC